MKFKLEFNMDNDAFQLDKCDEVIRILAGINSRLNNSKIRIDVEDEYPVFDSNGNKIGKLEITE